MEPRDAFKFCPKCGGKLDPKPESLQCVNCGFNLYINPIPCNGVIIENQKGEILLVKRKFEPQKGCWDVPGGFIQPKESFEHSVKREIKEELGVEVEVVEIAGIYTDDYLFQGIKNATLCLIASAKIINGTLKASDDVEEYKYFPRELVPQQKIAFTGIRKALEDYLNK